MRLELSGRARALLRRFPRTNVYSLAEIVLIGLLAVQCARLLWTIVTPVTPLGDWRPVRPGFAGEPTELLKSFDPFFRLVAPAQPSTVTALQLTLYGVRLNEATGTGSAIIATPDGTQTSVAVGQEIMPGATLKAVAFDHVTIDHGGALEDLYLDQSKAVTPVAAPAAAPAAPPGPPPTLAQLNSAGASFGDLKAGIGFIPRIDGGRVTGLVVRPQGDGHIFAQSGLQQGDVVTEVMGKPIRGADDIAAAADKVKNGGILSLMVERNGQTVPIGVNVTGS
jgi:general secretion pathway protein C